MFPAKSLPALLGIYFLTALWGAAANSTWAKLETNNPFIAFKPPEPPPPAKPSPLEFRGLSVEHGTRYFSFYNQETKKSFWLQEREVHDGWRVRSFEPGSAVVIADASGTIVSLSMKETKLPAGSFPPHSNRPNRALVMAGLPARPEVSLALGAGESQRLEQVAEQVRIRRGQRLAAAGKS